MDIMSQHSAGVMSQHSVGILKNGIILDKEDITTLEDTNVDIEYKYVKDYKCKGFTLLHKLVLLTNKYPKLNNVIKDYIALYPKEVNKVNEHGINALIIASLNSSCRSSIETVKILLMSPNTMVNAGNYNGTTALMFASIYSNRTSSIETVKLLLMSYVKNTADINAKNDYGMTALMYASSNSNGCSSRRTVKLLLEYDAIPDKKFPKFENNIKLLNVLS